MNRIEERFRKLREEGGKAFIPYIMAGDPSLRVTEDLFRMLSREGADIIELGVPFSDPLADGPTIQAAAERALSGGTTLRKVLGLVKRLRRSGEETPVVLMTYMNPVHAYGIERFMKDASSAGVDGLIIPDLPPDEGRALRDLAHQNDISTIFLLAPTSTPGRIGLVASASSGFIYYVSITGITGSSLRLSPEMKKMVGRIRKKTDKPVCVGFGVKTPDDATAITAFADGVIVGSSIVKMAHEKPGKLPGYIRSLRRAIPSGEGGL